MNLNEEKYSKYALTREMMDTIEVVKNFNPDQTKDVAKKIASAGRLLLTGEGSSRIFPAKNAIRKALTSGLDLCIATDGSRQSAQYDLSKFAVFCASNSGRTKEVVLLAKMLAEIGNDNRFALSANEGTLIEDACKETFILTCGWEQAVAATKSVIEQALFYESILWHINNNTVPGFSELATKIETALTMPIEQDIISAAANAPTIYFAGYNDGVVEELTLKTNEITRKKSDYLEGTYAVHGIEEVMEKDDIVFVVDPIDDEIEKFQEVLAKGVGLKIVAIADRDTPFTTIRVPGAGEMAPYVYLSAGWNLLVEIGLALNINLDKPERARKVGNEFVG
ncbi:MAG: sugar isomerase [Bacteroidetes bacterium 4484_276]|nr:MAG: sugar isomerase [Bacteroidetes bacterium 4484_276]OYT12588.1 MAG: sugar isomerase [Bacteroidetes bacterium 4572_114]